MPQPDFVGFLNMILRNSFRIWVHHKFLVFLVKGMSLGGFWWRHMYFHRWCIRQRLVLGDSGEVLVVLVAAIREEILYLRLNFWFICNIFHVSLTVVFWVFCAIFYNS